jgi:hypothetical protein
MMQFTLDTNQLQLKASRLKHSGQTLCRLSNQLMQQVRYLPTRSPQLQRIELLATKLNKMGTRLIQLSNSFDDIVDRALRDDKFNETYVLQALARFSEDTKNNNGIVSLASNTTTRSELEKVVEQIIYGDFTKEFSWLGFGAGVLLGFTPIGFLQDARDLTHSAITYKERTLVENAALIGLGVIGFVPLLGDFTKIEAKLLKNGTKVAAVVRHVDEIDEASAQLMKQGDELLRGAKILGNGQSLLENARIYADLVNKNVNWSWTKDFKDAHLLSYTTKHEIKKFATELGLIPKIEFKIKDGIIYPDFKGPGLVRNEVKLPLELWPSKNPLVTDEQQLKYLKSEFQKKGIDIPEGYTWHHDPIEPGNMQLVPFGIHNVTHHDGPYNIKGSWAYREAGRK